MAGTRIEQRSQLVAEQTADVLRLVDEVTEAEGVRPLSEHVMLQVRHATEANIRHLLLWSETELVGYAQLDLEDIVAELAATDPANARVLVDRLIATAGEPLQVWARGQNAATAAVLQEMGFAPKRVLLQLRRSLLEPPLAEPSWPVGVTVRTFVVGEDEPAWLEVNNQAFADHPDQSGWTLADVVTREHEPWFDPAGFFLAERDGDLVGFHWTKVHGAQGADHDRIGEVYVIGVAPSMQGQHLGSALTLAGLVHLRQLGLETVMLYVDESNSAAVRVYERLGFTRWDEDVSFAR